MKITEVLVTEHRIFAGVFAQIERALPRLATLTEVRTLAGVVEGMLADHGATETELAYLALDHVLHDQGRLARLHQEHEEIDASLREAQVADDCARARTLLAAALRAIRDHMVFEERQVFPLLDRALRPETLTELAGIWSRGLAAPLAGPNV